MTDCPCGPLLLDAAAVAAVLSLAPADAEELMRCGALATVTVAGQRRARRDDVGAFVAALVHDGSPAIDVQEDHWLTVPAMAARLGLHAGTVRDLVRRGHLGHQRVGAAGQGRAAVMFTPEDVAAAETGAYAVYVQRSREFAALKAGRRAWAPDLTEPLPDPPQQT